MVITPIPAMILSASHESIAAELCKGGSMTVRNTWHTWASTRPGVIQS